MTGVAIVVCLFPAVAAAPPPGRLDLEPEELRPGLVAEYRSLAEPTATTDPGRAEAGVPPRPVQPAPAPPARAVRGRLVRGDRTPRARAGLVLGLRRRRGDRDGGRRHGPGRPGRVGREPGGGKGAASAAAGLLPADGPVPVAGGRAGPASALVGGAGVRPGAAAGLAPRAHRRATHARRSEGGTRRPGADRRRPVRLRPLSPGRVPRRVATRRRGRRWPTPGAASARRGC